MANVSEKYVYLDYAATAPLCEEAAAAMAPYFIPGRENMAVGGNANSLHTPGRSAFEALESARRLLARDLGARRPDEIIFTSGATEADNAALFGLAHAAAKKRRQAKPGSFTPHIITTSIEHDAVLMPVKQLEAEGFRVTRLAPNRRGFIGVSALEEALGKDTVLVAIQAANAEVGSIQPIADLSRAAHKAGALFFTDAVQALGKAFVGVESWGVDAASFAAHKIGGPKGVGALYLKTRTPFDAYVLGGGQEAKRRSGTQNVAGAQGFAAAAHAVQSFWEEESSRLRALRDELYTELAKRKGVETTISVDAGDTSFLPNIVHILVDGMESETLILRLDRQGFGVSGGSACSSHSLEPSHVLRAIGVEGERAYGALRISMGRYTTHDDIKAFIRAFDASLDWE